MAIRNTITVTLTTRGEVDQPCTAACPDLALSTDGPTVAAALHALAKAIEYLPPSVTIAAAEANQAALRAGKAGSIAGSRMDFGIRRKFSGQERTVRAS